MKNMARSGLVGTFAALFMSAQLAAAQTRPDTPNNPFADSASAIDTGRAIFGGTCSACHGEGGTGGRGPALNTGSFSHGGEDTFLFPGIRGGIPGPQMPSFASFPADDVWRVVAYLSSLPPRSAAATGDVVAGEAVFFG